jgi:hypothetical protein
MLASYTGHRRLRKYLSRPIRQVTVRIAGFGPISLDSRLAGMRSDRIVQRSVGG